jgi:hypothetical protein
LMMIFMITLLLRFMSVCGGDSIPSQREKVSHAIRCVYPLHRQSGIQSDWLVDS